MVEQADLAGPRVGKRYMNSIEIAVPKQELAEGGDSTWRDWLGIVASVGCAIHCAAMPFVIAYLPALGLSFLADESFHQWMALICFLIAIAAFIPGILKHGSWVPVSIGAAGLVLITYAAFGLSGECCASCSAHAANDNDSPIESSCCDEHCESHEMEDADQVEGSSLAEGLDVSGAHSEPVSFLSGFAPWITPIGGMFLVAAHLINRRYGYNCRCCHAGSAQTPEPKTI